MNATSKEEKVKKKTIFKSKCSPILLSSLGKAKQSKDSKEFCNCEQHDKLDEATVEPRLVFDSPLETNKPYQIQQTDLGDFDTHSPLPTDLILENTSKMDENVGALVEQISKLTQALAGSTTAQEKSALNIIEKQGQQLEKLLKEQTEIRKNNSSGTGSTCLDKFTGDHNQDITSWLESFDCYVAFHNWSDERKSAALPLFLKNSAKIYYSSLTPETKQNFGATAEVLCK